MMFSPSLRKARTFSMKSLVLASMAFHFFTTELSASSTQGSNNAEPAPKSPFATVIDSLCTTNVKALSLNRARTHKSDIDTRVGFQQWQASLGSLDLKDEDGSIGSLINVGVKSSDLKWRQSPYFGTSHQYNFFVEGAHHFELDLPVELHAHARLETDFQGRQIAKYTMGAVTLWASKNYNDVNYSLGFYKEIGRHSQCLRPVLGVHTKLYEDLDLDLLLPFHAKVLYNLYDPCTLYAGVKMLKDRQKTQPSDSYSKSIWQYQTSLMHVGASYHYLQIAQASLELGRSLAPNVKVYDAEGHHLITQRVKGSLYAEVSINIFF
jgi:hypothetical protein